MFDRGRPEIHRAASAFAVSPRRLHAHGDIVFYYICRRIHELLRRGAQHVFSEPRPLGEHGAAPGSLGVCRVKLPLMENEERTRIVCPAVDVPCVEIGHGVEDDLIIPAARDELSVGIGRSVGGEVCNVAVQQLVAVLDGVAADFLGGRFAFAENAAQIVPIADLYMPGREHAQRDEQGAAQLRRGALKDYCRGERKQRIIDKQVYRTQLHRCEE